MIRFTREMDRCTIIPPHMLDALATSGDPELAARARESRAIDERLLRARRGRPEARGDETPIPPSEDRETPGPNRSIHDAKGEQDLPGEVVRKEGEPATQDVAVNEAYDGLGATWELWANAYGRDSLDGKGLPLVATVHYGKDYDNAFWEGAQMVFGDGDGVIFNRFTASLDVIGHELAHGITQYTSGLNYQGQSGALNEHVSDVFGVLVTQHHLDQSADEADWLIGADLLAEGVKGVALRSMAAPGTAYDDPRLGKDPQPAHMDDFVVTSADNGGVHINSGIPNRAFYLAATAIGGRAWEVAGQVWVDTILGDIRADCDFERFAALTIQAAQARYGAWVTDIVTDAWAQVGIGSSQRPDRPGPAQEDEPPSRPLPTHDSELTLTRSGGFAGLTRRRTVTLGDLPEQDAHAFTTLIANKDLAAVSRAPAVPDGFCYGLECDRPPINVQIGEPALSARTRALFERTLADAEPEHPQPEG